MANKEHTGFRNGDMFCFNCGDSHKMVLPMELGKYSELLVSFGKRHKKCPKTWEEPKIEDSGAKTVDDKMKWWIDNGEHGTSSKTMYSVMSGQAITSERNFSHPCDPDDFRRCYLLLKAIPEFKKALWRMKIVSETWVNLVDNWDKLTEMLEEQMTTKKANGMYEFMKTLGC